MGKKDYTYKSHGTNSKGNHYCARDYGSDAPNKNAYHYSNSDGSYYYSNSDGSKYHNDGKGGATYTPPASAPASSASSASSGSSKK
ncbi:hypothetical protein DFH27DRAFT_614003 [Peziza echinospora]|nr:hypothetical protein DFH27DRAFT_614003 [Peziza echinospora]